MAGIPLLKLASMFVKVISKPLSTRLTYEASRYPKFNDFCQLVGESSHQLTSRINIVASGYKILKVKPLSADEALNNGVTIISESVVYIISGTIIILEYRRNELKGKQKTIEIAQKESEFNEYLQSSFSKIENKLLELEKRIEDIERQQQAHRLETQPIKVPDKKNEEIKPFLFSYWWK